MSDMIAAATARLNDELFNHNDKEAIIAIAAEKVVDAARASKTSIAKFPHSRLTRILDAARIQWELDVQAAREAVIETEAPKALIVKTMPNGDKYGVVIREAAAEAVSHTKGAHADCDHANSKVARAKCRRERARAAKAADAE